jgi:hypothetical protein
MFDMPIARCDVFHNFDADFRLTTPRGQGTAPVLLPPPPPAGAAGGPDGSSNVALSGVCLRIRAFARPRARLLPAQAPRATEAMNVAC